MRKPQLPKFDTPASTSRLRIAAMLAASVLLGGATLAIADNDESPKVPERGAVPEAIAEHWDRSAETAPVLWAAWTPQREGETVTNRSLLPCEGSTRYQADNALTDLHTLYRSTNEDGWVTTWQWAVYPDAGASASFQDELATQGAQCTNILDAEVRESAFEAAEIPTTLDGDVSTYSGLHTWRTEDERTAAAVIATTRVNNQLLTTITWKHSTQGALLEDREQLDAGIAAATTEHQGLEELFGSTMP